MDEQEKAYFKKAFAAAVAAEQQLAAAQQAFQEANSGVVGFIQYMKQKYGLPANAMITPDGEFILPKES